MSVGRTISIALSLATQGFQNGLNSASGSLNQFARASNQSLASVATVDGLRRQLSTLTATVTPRARQQRRKRR